jgi:glycosyltransferase involved in cell wall biosynthesis
MNILGIFSAFRPLDHVGPVGGGEISNRQLFSRLAARGHNVSVYAFNAGYGSERHAHGISVLDGGLGRPGIVDRFCTVIRSRFDLTPWYDRFAPDVVLASPSTVGTALRLARPRNVPVAVMVRAQRDMLTLDSGNPMTNAVKRLVYGWSRWSDSPFLIANSNFLLGVCRSEGFEGVGWTVYPPIDVEVSGADWPNRIRKIGMIGSSLQKGIETFLELADRMPGIEFLVIGDRSVPAGAGVTVGNLTRMGWMNDPVEAIDDCDAILMATRYEEAFGRAAVEAICRKKYVLVSRVGGLPEAVADERLLVDPLNADAWYERVMDLVSDPVAFVPAVSRALEVARSFSLERQSMNLENALHQMVGGLKDRVS